MAICPIVSRPGEPASCREDCQWWTEIEGQPEVSDCTMNAIARNIWAFRSVFPGEFKNIISAIRSIRRF